MAGAAASDWTERRRDCRTTPTNRRPVGRLGPTAKMVMRTLVEGPNRVEELLSVVVPSSSSYDAFSFPLVLYMVGRYCSKFLWHTADGCIERQPQQPWNSRARSIRLSEPAAELEVGST
jgi:hypothetical protein